MLSRRILIAVKKQNDYRESMVKTYKIPRGLSETSDSNRIALQIQAKINYIEKSEHISTSNFIGQEGLEGT